MAKLVVEKAVAEALRNGVPVVALESTIIAHGMPYPENLACGRQLEDAVRQQGAVPATIAVLDGELRVGLKPEDMDVLAKTPGIAKLSRRDIAITLARKAHGATTVAATMLIAHLAGIRVFATGGIGGVHRGAESSFDISADLEELARTPVAVVCAGAKAILDLPKTLEYLETKGVPVLGYRTEEFPAFYSRESGLPVDGTVQDPGDAAEVMHSHWQLPHAGGILVSVPVPDEQAIPASKISGIIANAVAEARSKGIRGKEETPFLLKRVKELTQGESLATNIALAKNNATVAAAIATAFSVLGK